MLQASLSVVSHDHEMYCGYWL